MKVISLCTQKGGVGKTTTVLHVASAIKKWWPQINTLTIDIDPQGNLSEAVGAPSDAYTWADYCKNDCDIEDLVLETQIGHFIPCNQFAKEFETSLVTKHGREIKLRRIINQVNTLGKYDLVLIDCPPQFGVTTVNALVASDKVYTPLQMEGFAKQGMEQFFESVCDVQEQLDCDVIVGGIIRTMADERLKVFKKAQEHLDLHYKDHYLTTIVRRNTDLAACVTMKKPVYEFAPTSAGSIDYKALTEEILKKEELV